VIWRRIAVVVAVTALLALWAWLLMQC